MLGLIMQFAVSLTIVELIPLGMVKVMEWVSDGMERIYYGEG